MTTFTTAYVGCKVSQADCEAAARVLAAAGLEPAPDDEADVALVMSCCVTAEAERKSRHLASRLARRGARVVVAGCASRLRPEQFRGDRVAPLDDLAPGRTPPAGEAAVQEGAAPGARGMSPFETPDDLAAAMAGVAGVAVASPTAGRRRLVGLPGVFERSPAGEGQQEVVRDGGRTRLMLKIQDGCSQTCSYCTVRLARGTPAGLPLAGVLERARRGLAAGCGEIVLTGVNLGGYRDEASGAGLAAAVEAITALPALRRLRLSSLEPGHLTPRLLAALAHERVARHLHVPLQSADDRVLADMARPYAFAEYLRLIARAREAIGDVAITTDVIVGFPTEDETAFARTLAAMSPAAGGHVLGGGLFERVHVFKYSRRPDTPAEQLGELAPGLVKDRMGRALGVARDAQRAAHLRRREEPAEVLVEERRDGLWRGYGSHYVRYYLKGDAARGELVKAVGEETFADGLKGRILERSQA